MEKRERNRGSRLQRNDGDHTTTSLKPIATTGGKSCHPADGDDFCQPDDEGKDNEEEEEEENDDDVYDEARGKFMDQES